MAKQTTTGIRLDDSTRRILEIIAKRAGVKSSDIIRFAIEDYLRRTIEAGELKLSIHGTEARALELIAQDHDLLDHDSDIVPVKGGKRIKDGASAKDGTPLKGKGREQRAAS
ncbi:hypothetical protein [Geminisphaera colitermitum]|uniref:hypothetical protein n=1 Tax=Geminisphaera colitermitum TaxID=1148786 RepID=UPI0001965552|nr:hypothetical protein [Geminisphaera colitermitum]